MGLNTQGYRTDPGPQVVRLSHVRSHFIHSQKEMLKFISSGERPPRLDVRWSDAEGSYVLADEKSASIFVALQFLGHSYIDVFVRGEEPLDDVEIEERG